MFSSRIRKDEAAPSAFAKAERRSPVRTVQEGTAGVYRDARDKRESTTTPAWDFSQVSVFPSDRPASSVHAGATSEVKRRRYTFSAVVPRAQPVYSDAARHDDRKAATTSAGRSNAAGGPVRFGEAIHFPGVFSPTTPVPSQSDMGITSSFQYTSAITQTHDAPDPGDFGTTRPNYTLAHVAAVPQGQNFAVTGDINADIKFSVASPGQKNIGSDSDPNITQANYLDVVKDLTPLAATVTRGGRKIFKDEPPRDHFWAEDITVTHERFHADEDVRFGQQGVTVAQNLMNTQRVAKIDDIEGLLQPIINKVRDTVSAAMTYPGREERAYANGAPLYRDRAQAIKHKGDAKGYVPQPPAAQPPAPQPPAPKSPAPQSPAPQAPAPQAPALSPAPPRHPEK